MKQGKTKKNKKDVCYLKERTSYLEKSSKGVFRRKRRSRKEKRAGLKSQLMNERDYV